MPPTQSSSSVQALSAAREMSDAQMRSNQSYNNVVSSGNSRLHAGNVYNNHYHLATLRTTQVEATSDEQRRLLQTLLRYLHFKVASSRHAGIATAHPDTCRWVVSFPHYKRWRDQDATAEHHGCPRVKGKPGAGKSAIMNPCYAMPKSFIRMKKSYPSSSMLEAHR